MSIGSIGFLTRTSTYLKTGAVALLVSMSACSKHSPIVMKDVIEFSQPTAAKLIGCLENGARHSRTVFLTDTAHRVLSKKDMKNYKVVPDTLLEKLKTLPDTMELYYQVYKGKADKLIQKKLNKKDNLLTVGHGNIGRNYIKLAGNKRVYEGDYISQFSADSLFNVAINQKDSILRANLSEKAYKKLKTHQKDAVLSYLYNVNETLLSKRDSTRTIPESFFDCVESYIKGDKNALGKIQAKFNVTPSAQGAAAGLAKRNLIQLLVFGNGEIYNNPHAQKNVERILDIFKNRKDCDKIIKEVYSKLEKYGVNSRKLEGTKEKIQKYLHPDLKNKK